jgi:hypothetical protein
MTVNGTTQHGRRSTATPSAKIDPAHATVAEAVPS